jgi:hypothetical protein
MRSVPLPEFGEVESEKLKPGHEVAGFKILQRRPIWIQADQLTYKQGCGSALISCGSGYGYGSRSQCGSGSSSRSRVLMTKNWKIIFPIFSKIAIYLSLGLPKERARYRRSLQPSKENIQNLKH